MHGCPAIASLWTTSNSSQRQRLKTLDQELQSVDKADKQSILLEEMANRKTASSSSSQNPEEKSDSPENSEEQTTDPEDKQLATHEEEVDMTQHDEDQMTQHDEDEMPKNEEDQMTQHDEDQHEEDVASASPRRRTGRAVKPPRNDSDLAGKYSVPPPTATRKRPAAPKKAPAGRAAKKTKKS